MHRFSRSHFPLVAAFFASVLLAACGLPGAPQPPSLQLPRPVDDLAAWRKGDIVYLSWTPPQRTTDGQLLRQRGVANVCRAVAEPRMDECVNRIAQVPPAGESTAESVKFTETLVPELQRQYPLQFATYAVQVLNGRGRAAGLSNQVQVPLAPTLPPPMDLKAEVTANGVVLTWSGMLHEHDAPELRHVYRVYRQVEGDPQTEVRIGQVQLSAEPRASFVDSSFEWGSKYRYVVTAVTVVPVQGRPVQDTPVHDTVEVEGEDSAPVSVTPADLFPPAAPTAVEAVFVGQGQERFIDLIWNPSGDTDLAGYNIYRSAGGEAPVKINADLVPTPAFRDSQVQPGTTYEYFITAVDVRGNESERSGAARESVP